MVEPPKEVPRASDSDDAAVPKDNDHVAGLGAIRVWNWAMWNGEGPALPHIPTDRSANVLIALVGHKEPKPGDPVHVIFEGLVVTSASIAKLSDLSGAEHRH